jgi:hypothetical protein
MVVAAVLSLIECYVKCLLALMGVYHFLIGNCYKDKDIENFREYDLTSFHLII